MWLGSWCLPKRCSTHIMWHSSACIARKLPDVGKWCNILMLWFLNVLILQHLCDLPYHHPQSLDPLKPNAESSVHCVMKLCTSLSCTQTSHYIIDTCPNVELYIYIIAYCELKAEPCSNGPNIPDHSNWPTGPCGTHSWMCHCWDLGTAHVLLCTFKSRWTCSFLSIAVFIQLCMSFPTIAMYKSHFSFISVIVTE